MEFKVKSVIFDMDGVITNTMPDHYRSWKQVLGEYGIYVTYHDIYRREGQPGMSTVREIFSEHQKPFEEKQARYILRKKEDLFKEIVKVRFIVGARNFLKWLHRNNFRLALVTGTSRHELYQILPKYLRELFSVIITGSDVTHGKPHPEPYLTALKNLNIKSSDAVVIENAPFGICSARASGIKCLALETSLSREYLKEANAVFSSFKEMQEKVSFCFLQ